MNWGAGIVVAFVAFAIVIFTMVFISMNQEINLVSEDYYKQEIEYEDQIQRIRNTRELEQGPEIEFDRSNLDVVVRFPGNISGKIKDGYIHLFRPSDSSLDKKYRLKLDKNGEQIISVISSSKGLWKVKLFWEDDLKEYYFEKTLTY